MARTIRRRVRVGPDRILHMQLPDDFPTGEGDVIIRESAVELSTVPSAKHPSADDRQLQDELRESLRKLMDPDRELPTGEQARAAADALLGMFKGDGHVVDDFLRERREEDERHERHLMSFGADKEPETP